jgi:hypothetical protein
LLALLLAASLHVHAKEWRGIVPLHSTRADVEHILGRPFMDHGDTVVYQYETEKASIEYSKGPCSVELSPWNVPRDTVISIWVTPKQLYFSDLKLDLTKYKKKQDDELSYIFNYVDENEGLSYQVNERISGSVTVIKYFPAARDEKLKCPEPANYLKESIKFAEFSDFSPKTEKKHLDAFARQLVRYTLINYASAEGHILAYAGKRSLLGEAKARAECAKEYLVKVRGIKLARIETRDAGYREKPTIELYLIRPGGTAPFVRPTLEQEDVQIIKGATRNSLCSLLSRRK